MDYYQWIEPFAAIEQANHRAARAREDGRNDVLNYEYRNPGLLQRAIEDQAYRLAEKVVLEQIRPVIPDAITRHRLRDAALDLLNCTPTRHIVGMVETKTVSRPIWDFNDRDFCVMTEVEMKPFRYVVADRLA